MRSEKCVASSWKIQLIDVNTFVPFDYITKRGRKKCKFWRNSSVHDTVLQINLRACVGWGHELDFVGCNRPRIYCELNTQFNNTYRVYCEITDQKKNE